MSPSLEDTVAKVQAIREGLWRNGFRPLALVTGDKAIYEMAWPTNARLDPPAAVTNPVTESKLNTGILCDGLAGVDNDVDDPELAARIDEARERILGTNSVFRQRSNTHRTVHLYRYAEGEGEPPKRRVAGPVITPRGPGVPKDVKHAVEVLGRGSNLHVDGLHPSGVPVQWSIPLHGFLSRASLPEVTTAQVDAFLTEVAVILGAEKPQPYQPPVARTVAPPGEHEPRRNTTASRIGLPRLRRLLAWIDPSDRDDWRNVCFAMRDAVILGVEDSEALALFDEWASGALWKAAPEHDRLRECFVGEYDGLGDNQNLWEGRHGSPARPAAIGSLVHLAVKHAARLGQTVPNDLVHQPKDELFDVVEARPSEPEPAPAETDRFSELEAHFRGVLAAAKKRERRGKRFGDVENDPPPAWIIDGWAPEGGVDADYGESENYKTYLNVHKLLCVATGNPFGRREGFAGYRVGPPRPVAIFAGEGSNGVKQRIKAAIVGNNFDRELVRKNLIFIDDVYAINRADGLAAMADEIEAHESQVALIVVDTFNLALDGNEDSAEEVKKGIRGMRALAEMFRACGVLIDHVGHTEKDRQRGSSAKRANQDVMTLCKRDGDIVTLTQKKNRHAVKEEHRLAFRAHKIEIGIHPETNEPITDLWFEPIDPATIPFQSVATAQEDAARSLYVASAKTTLDRHEGGAMSPLDLARKAVAAVAPDIGEDTAAWKAECKRVRQWLVRAFAQPELRAYVASLTPNEAEVSTFRRPVGRRQRTG